MLHLDPRQDQIRGFERRKQPDWLLANYPFQVQLHLLLACIIRVPVPVPQGRGTGNWIYALYYVLPTTLPTTIGAAGTTVRFPMVHARGHNVLVQ